MAEISAEIQRSFDFLEGEVRDLPERQRTMRAVFNHSWNLLSDAEKSALQQLSVFRGGFARNAAQRVVEVSLKTLTSLVNKSLLHRDPSGRYDIHELLRQFAAEQLAALPETEAQARERHAFYYADFMDQRWGPLRSMQVNVATTAIEIEIDNVRAAWNLMVEQAYFVQMALTARVLWHFLELRAQFEEGIDHFGRAVDKLRTLTPNEARDKMLGEALHNLAYFHIANGSADKGKRLAEESLALLENYNAAEIMVRAYLSLCRAEYLLGSQPAMKQHAQRAVELAHAISDPWYRAFAVFIFGMMTQHLSEYEASYSAGQEALQIAEKAADPYLLGLCSGRLLGLTALRMGQYTEAKRYYLRSIACFESIRHYDEVALSKRELSEVYALSREYDFAKRAYQDSLRYYVKAGPVAFLIENLRSIALLFEMQGEYARAVEMLALLIHHPATFSSDILSAETTVDRLRTHLPSAEFSTAFDRGTALNLEAVVAELLT